MYPASRHCRKQLSASYLCSHIGAGYVRVEVVGWMSACLLALRHPPCPVSCSRCIAPRSSPPHLQAFPAPVLLFRPLIVKQFPVLDLHVDVRKRPCLSFRRSGPNLSFFHTYGASDGLKCATCPHLTYVLASEGVWPSSNTWKVKFQLGIGSAFAPISCPPLPPCTHHLHLPSPALLQAWTPHGLFADSQV